jgi:hypothetical protein
MWRITAKLLWAFEFTEDPSFKLDSDAYNPGILQAPLPFKIKITPRSQEHINCIRDAETEALEFLKQYD